MDYKDYYKALGVERTATQDEIKRAYRKLARKYHPDVNTEDGADAKFKEAGEAFAVLGDAEKRAAYDQLGAEPQGGGQGFRPPPDWDQRYHFSERPHGAGGPDDAAFSDFFENLFRSGSRAEGFTSRRQAAGQDQHARVVLDLEDAYHGTTRVLTMQSPEMDDAGRLVMKNRSVSVKIPKGVREGQHIRLKGKGSPGFGGGPAGDLFLEVSFAPHPTYRIDGRDIYVDLPVAPWEAALGGKISMPTPAGEVGVTVPKNARAGQKLRLKGRGLPGKRAGDLYAVLKIVNPPKINDKARALYEQMAQEMKFDPRKNMEG
ncbi:DnaJ C-terminal domain-containing protein [Litoreibacter arenae]|uniref:DnaJ-class molecular chaperone CbpA n=1 Tax=Litoreibacter arenae DSM 19593 TaxID=1123360 RepID=S9QK35_9RHOB|nr:DnaJ C-terminal domain-containing protein [Litoreibacter arenae]EPX80122.1 DnaJ-class molecular chaperone CbpA [Litoreibacter arenae DSM 19593]